MSALKRALSMLLMLVIGCAVIASAAAGAYTNFEITPVRPLALSPDGARLYAVNTPDGRLEIFDVLASGLRYRASVPVGLEPVAVAVRTPTEVWVVNHLSDSVSIVDAGSSAPRVVRTLLVGDQPWDVVFGGPRSHPRDPFPRAFISAARRGQNHPENPNAQILERSEGNADVWVFDAENLGAPLGGTPEKIVRVFGDKPRPLAVTPDGSRVYVGVFHSGSRTTTINPSAVCDGGPDRGPCTLETAGRDDPPESGEIGRGEPPVLPGGTLGPQTDAEGNPAPEASLIVKYFEDVDQWQDAAGRNWNGGVAFMLPDLDVFAIDALAETPREIASYAGVGTILYGMAVHPDGRIFVSNTEANNFDSLVGREAGPTSLRGHLHKARVSILAPGGGVTSRHLNKHIDYDLFPQPPSTRERSLATPQGLAFSPGGRTLFVAAFGSSKLGVFDVDSLADDSFTPDARDHIELSDGGPCGIVTDERHRRLYVYTRLGNSISVVDPRRRRELASIPLHSPEPAVVTEGRRFLYDARHASSNGEASCSACHVLGDMDDLAWDLGDPSDVEFANPNPFLGGPQGLLHPVKGPMVTQTLRGLANNGPMHWRGDQTGARDPLSGDAFDEVAAFRAFNDAFPKLLGRDEGRIPQEEMQAFAEFGLTIAVPPNPIRSLDNLDRGALAYGRETYFRVQTNTVLFRCNSCHTLDPAQGFFGTAGLSIFDPGDFKIPHLRNIYEKVGGMGMTGERESDLAPRPDHIRGFGLLHEGSMGDLSTFFTLAGFVFPDGPEQKDAVMSFVMAFPSNLAPIVGQQVTRSPSSDARVDERIDLLVDQATTEWIVRGNPGPMSCDLTVRGVLGGEARGWTLDVDSGLFESDRRSEPPLSDAALRAIADEPGQELTYTCVPPASGPRMGIDRDGDGARDGDELALYTDLRSAASLSGACSDGVDNDGDGAIDHPADADCSSPDGRSELGAPAVRIDVRPRQRRNVFASGARFVPVAVLGSAQADVRLVDPDGSRLGPGRAAPLGEGKLRDVNGDGHPDLVQHFDASQAGLRRGRMRLCLEGEIGGSPFAACDRVWVKAPPTVCEATDFRSWLRCRWRRLGG